MKIESISNKTLRKAAQEADSDGAKKFNGTLDACELETFMKKAYAAGCCTGDILSVAGNVTVDSNDKDTANKVKLLQDIEKLEKEIETKKKQLKEKEAKLKEMTPTKRSEYVGAAIGGAVGVVFGGCTSFAVAVSGPIGWAIAAGVAMGAMSIPVGVVVGRQIGKEEGKESYEYKTQMNSANQYEASDVYPLKNEISTLENNLEVKKASLYK